MNPESLSYFETCQRKGYWGQFWEAQRLSGKEMAVRAIREAVIAPEAQEAPFGEVAGSAVLQLAEDRGLAVEGRTVYAEVIHYAALSDILVSAIRKPKDRPWIAPPEFPPDCFLSSDGNYLRRIVLVSHWTDSRKESEARSWKSLGLMAEHNLPMQLAVLVIGQNRAGKRRGPWTQGYLHPSNHQLRFRRRKGGFRSEGNRFKETWEQIYREDHAEISRETWLQSMLTDDVLPEVCFSIELPVLEPPHRQRILQMAEHKLDALHSLKEKPDAQLSTCDWPVACQFKKCCHVEPEREPSEKLGFVRIQTSQG